VLRSGPLIGKSGEPETSVTPLNFSDVIFQNANSILLEGVGNLFAVVPPIMVSQDRIDSERRFEVFKAAAVTSGSTRWRYQLFETM
jgi:hypothetical protein